MSFIRPCPHDGRYPRYCVSCALDSPEMVPYHMTPRERRSEADLPSRRRAAWTASMRAPRVGRARALLGRVAALLAVLGALALAGRGL